MIQELYLRNIIKEVMRSQGFEVCNRPMPRVIYGDRNYYKPFWNKIILYDNCALVHELVHNLQPDHLFQNKYISYKKDYRLYRNVKNKPMPLKIF